MLLWPVLLIALVQTNQLTPRFERLGNGLRVVIVEDHALPLVSVQLWYRVGSSCDPPDKPGLCQVARAVLEHRDDAALKLRAAGLCFASRTLRDACHFSSVLPPNFLEYVLDIEAARMRPLTARAEMVERGLNAAARNYAADADDPNHVVMRQVLAAMFPAHPYQHPPGFAAASLKNLSSDEANEFLKRWFVPGSATLFVIGDVSTVRVRDQVRERFGKLEWAEPPRPAEPKRLDPETIRVSVTHPDRAGLLIAWRTPPMGYFENAALDVLMQRLCNSVDGPLDRRLRKAGWQPPRWHRYAWREAGMLVLSIDAVAGGSTQLEETVWAQLTAAAARIPTEIEHNRARALAAREVRERRAAFGTRALRLAAQEVVAGDILLAEFELPRVANVGAADVQQAAVMLRGARTVVMRRDARRGGLGTPASQPAEPQLVGPLPAAASERLGPADALALLAQHAHEVPATGPAPSPPQVVTRCVLGRIVVTVCFVPGLELATVCTSVTGEADWPRVMPALPATGSTQHSPEQLRDYLTYHGIELTTIDQAPRRGLCATGPASRVPQMVELQAELIRRPNLDAKRLAGALRRLANARRWERARAAAYADALAREVTMPKEIRSAAQLGRLLRELAAKTDVEVVVVGDVDAERVFADAEETWAHFPPLEIPGAKAKPLPGDVREAMVIPKKPKISLILWAPGAPDSVELRLLLHAPRWLHLPGPFDLQCGARLFGPPALDVQELDGHRAWRWHANINVNDPVSLKVGARVSASEVTAEVEALLAYAATAQHGAPGFLERLELTKRLVRAGRFTTCDSSERIAEMLVRHLWPWSIQGGPGPELWIEPGFPPAPGYAVLVAVGGGEGVAKALEPFGSVTRIGPNP